MDKNMIHIDDLVRQHLNGEEQERAGAWLRMRDMLDKNMPTDKVAAGFNWRRMLTSAAVILAVATVGVGGYEYSTRYRIADVANSQIGMNSPASGNNSNATTAGLDNSTSTNNATPANVTGDELATTNAVASNTTTTPKANINTASSHSTTVKTDAQVTTQDNATANVKPVTAQKAYSTNPNTATNKNTVNHIANNTPKQTSNKNSNTNNNVAAHTPANNTTAQNSNTSNSTAQNTTQAATAPQKNEVAANTTRYMPTISQTTKLKVDPRTNTVEVVTVETGRGLAAIPGNAPAQPIVSHEPNKNVEPIANKNEMVSARQFIGPLPDAYASAGNDVAIASNSSMNAEKKAKKSRTGGGFDFINFGKIISDAQYQLGNTKINTGLIGGINSTFGNYNLRGFQVGLFTNVMFNEHWSVMVEGKYTQRFNNKVNTYINNYSSVTQETNGTFSQEQKDHYFKYSTASNLDLPIMLQYSAKKWSVFTGANLSYYFDIKAEETERTTGVTTGLMTAPKTETPMTTADFNSRFGTGFILGAGYQLSEMLRIDVRMNQMFWDNAKGTGAQRVSKDLYRTPQVQLNLGVRLGKDKESDK
jgi:hypothetical protein